MARVDNISAWNATVDRTLTVRRFGRQGILYEYELPYGANPMYYYKDAVNVKSIKNSTKYNNGKRPGQYQPIGDKRHFTYYQLKKMKPSEVQAFQLEQHLRRQLIKMLKEGLIDG